MQSAQVVTLKSGQENASSVDSKSPMHSFEVRTSSTLSRCYRVTGKPEIICGCPSGLLLHIARTLSTLPIPVQPRNSTVQCIFLAYFTPQVLPFPMVGRVPAQLSTPKLCKPFRIRFYAKRARKSFRFRFYEKHRGVGYCRRPRHSSRATRHFCVPLCFHDLTNPSFRLPTHIDFYFHDFHALTNPFSSKGFIFTSIQNPQGVAHQHFSNFQVFGHSNVSSLVFSHCCTLFVVVKKVICIGISNFWTLFAKHPGWGLRHRSKSACGNRNGQAYTENVDDDADDHHLEREGKLRGGGERHHDPVHKEIHGHAI
jgi:hypothetical protein